LLDLTVGGFEVLVVAMTAVYTVLGAPPDSAPRSEYNHVVNIYTGVIMGTVMIVLLFYILRRRWYSVRAATDRRSPGHRQRCLPASHADLRRPDGLLIAVKRPASTVRADWRRATARADR
jgi:hypothetical protein